MNNALLLLLLDSRAPAGAHHHSGAMEAAVMAGLVTDLAGAEDFCRTRLRTSAGSQPRSPPRHAAPWRPNELTSPPA